MKTVILTDSCCDLPIDFVKENNIEVMPLRVNIKGKEIKDDLGQSIEYKAFYDMIREGEMPSTSQVNAYEFTEVFEKYSNQGYSIIYIGFSSALSGCVNSARIAKENVEGEISSADITIIDTKCASMGLGLVVYYAASMLKNGASKDEVVAWIEDNKLKVNHWFTVDDLNHLKRGGRISATVATVGSLLGIKPTLKIDDEGKVIPGDKIKGRKKALKYLAKQLKDKAIKPEEQVIFICNADCKDEAEDIKKMILEEVKVKDIIITSIGSVIGTHGGPGTLGVVFIGTER